MRALLPSLLVILGLAPAQAALKTETVEYQQGETTLEGYRAWDDSFKGPRPGVLVVHEWTGVGDYVKRRTEQLAGLGYVALAADIYGKGVRPRSVAEASAEAGKYRADRKLMRARARAGLDELKRSPGVDPAKTAAIGYCFGGGAVLELARSGAGLKGVVSFHGNLDTPDAKDAANIKGRVLVLHGGADPFVPFAQVEAFKAEMEAAQADYQVVVYGGARHSFTNPASDGKVAGALYDAKADARSWDEMRSFLAGLFKD
ncbi:MAG: dienelactone hydrolase family protein [Elusimicrobia bacterium]|nr:dienelactone hydrolase family protein [Elusimicrobiota bacterium]